MSEVILAVFPILPTPYQVMLHLLVREKKGYRPVRTKLFTVEESKPLITRDSEGLAIINYEGIMEIVEQIGFTNIQQYELIHDDKEDWRVHWYTLEELKGASMKREILREWKEFEDWYFTRGSSVER